MAALGIAPDQVYFASVLPRTTPHADWAGLNSAIRVTGAERVFVTHGYTVPFRHWLESQGYDAGIVETQFTGDDAEAVVEAAP